MKRHSYTLLVITIFWICAFGARASAQTNDVPKQAPEHSAAISPSGDSTKLLATKVVRATYPEAAARDKVQGEVIVKVEISETGDVEHAEVVSVNPVLGPAAWEAAKQWKFQPYIHDGKAVKVNTKVPFDFDVLESTDVKGNSISIPVVSSQGFASPLIPGKIAAEALVYKVTPVYPMKAKTARVQGAVLLAVTITKEGAIQNVRAVSGHSMFVDTVLDAVPKWLYHPFLLKGQPTDVDTTIQVNFTMTTH